MTRIQTLACAALMLAAALSQVGCATVATHYQVRASLEREARANLIRGAGSRCMVDGKSQLINDVTFWAMIRENWPDYLKAVGLDFGICFAAYLIYRERQGDDVGDTFQTIYYQQPSDKDDDGGGE